MTPATIPLLGVVCMCGAGLLQAFGKLRACQLVAAIGFVLIIGGLFQVTPR